MLLKQTSTKIAVYQKTQMPVIDAARPHKSISCSWYSHDVNFFSSSVVIC